MTLQQAFTQNLNEMVAKKDTSICQMVDDIGISRSNIYRFMRGKGLPNLYTIWLISKYFGCGVDDLLEGAEK